MLGHAQAVEDCGAFDRGVEAGRLAQVVGIHAANGGRELGGAVGHQLAHGIEALGLLGDERLVYQALLDHDVEKPVGKGHVGAGPQLEVQVGVGREADVAGVHHDKVGSALNSLAQLHADDGVRLLGVGAHEHDDVGELGYVGNGVGHGTAAQGGRQTGD